MLTYILRYDEEFFSLTWFPVTDFSSLKQKCQDQLKRFALNPVQVLIYTKLHLLQTLILKDRL